MAKYLNSLDQDKIDSLAFVYTEGYRKGFINTGKDLSIKETVDIRYNIGFERIVKAAIKNLKKWDLSRLFTLEDMGLQILTGNTGLTTSLTKHCI